MRGTVTICLRAERLPKRTVSTTLRLMLLGTSAMRDAKVSAVAVKLVMLRLVIVGAMVGEGCRSTNPAALRALARAQPPPARL